MLWPSWWEGGGGCKASNIFMPPHLLLYRIYACPNFLEVNMIFLSNKIPQENCFASDGIGILLTETSKKASAVIFSRLKIELFFFFRLLSFRKLSHINLEILKNNNISNAETKDFFSTDGQSQNSVVCLVSTRLFS